MADLGSILGSAGIGGAIGKAIVSLELDTKKYNAELAASEAKTKTSTSAMGSSVSKFSALGATAFAAFGVAAVAGLAYSVKAAIDADAALLKLQNTMDNNAKLADRSIDSFQDQAEAIQLLTGTSDEAILSAQALVGQFDLTGAQVQELTPLIVDLSAKLGVDMDAAAKAVGKAVEGNTSGLQRYGIAIEEATGQGGEFQATLEGLRGTVEGFAEARGQAEPWRILAAQFDELAETVGKLLLPLLKGLTEAVKLIVGPLELLADNLDVVITVLAGFAAFRYLPGLLLRIGGALEALGATRVSGAMLSAAAGIDSVAVSLGAAAPAAAGFALAYGGITAAVAAWDPLQTVDDTEALRESMEVTTKAFGESEIVLGRVAVSSNLTGDAFDDTRRSLDEMRQVADIASQGMLNLAGETAKTKGEVADASQKIKNFAHLTDDELQEWSDSTKESFESYVINLEKVQEETDFTRKDLRDSFRAMLEHARDLNQAMRTLSREHWINDDFVKFLAEQPDKLILFADSNETQQRRMQTQWEKSGEILKNQVNDRLDDLTGILDGLDKGESKHKITIEYDYVGFDPSKPGMAAGQSGGATGQQR